MTGSRGAVLRPLVAALPPTLSDAGAVQMNLPGLSLPRAGYYQLGGGYVLTQTAYAGGALGVGSTIAGDSGLLMSPATAAGSDHLGLNLSGTAYWDGVSVLQVQLDVTYTLAFDTTPNARTAAYLLKSSASRADVNGPPGLALYVTKAVGEIVSAAGFLLATRVF